MGQTSPPWYRAQTGSNNVTFRTEEYKKSRHESNFQNESYCTEHQNNMNSSRRTFLLLRGSSYSLVELPTFLPASCIVQTSCQCQSCQGGSVKTALAATDTEITLAATVMEITLAEVLSVYQPSHKTMVRPTSQWTVMFVAIIFFTTCLLLVGFMLSITSQYQDITIARVLNSSDEIVDIKEKLSL